MPAPWHDHDWVFDCDGVLIDSNRVKTDAFFQAALPFGENAARRLVDYHTATGGVSRYKKVDYLFEEILKRPPLDREKDDVLERFAAATRQGLATCRKIGGAEEFLGGLEGRNKIVVSGGAQDEVRWALGEHGLASFFSGIFGSPATKEEILTHAFDQRLIRRPVVFVGDSEYDFIAAEKFGLAFVFLYGASEFTGWEDYFRNKDVSVHRDFHDMIASQSPSV